MREIIVTLTIALTLVAPGFARILNVPLEQPFATMRVPDKWHVVERGEMMEASSPDHAMHLLLGRPEQNKVSESIGELLRYIRSTGAIRVNPSSLKHESEELNGMKVRCVSWSGKDQGGEVKISFRVISVAENQRLLIAFWGSPRAEEKHHSQVADILSSIKKANASPEHAKIVD